MLKICLRYAQGIIPPSYPIKPNIIEGNKNHNMYKMPQRRDNAGAVCNSGMGMLFLCIYVFTLFL